MTTSSGEQFNKVLKIDVYGRRMIVAHSTRGWVALRPADDIVVPQSLGEDDIVRYFADLFHESATEKHPDVRLLE